MLCAHVVWPCKLGWPHHKVISTFAMQTYKSVQISMTIQAVLMCIKVQNLANGGYNQMAEKVLLAALQKAMEISASSIDIHKQDGILTAHVVEVATVLIISATPTCRVAVPGAELSSVVPQSVSGLLESASGVRSSQQSAMVPAVVQGATDLHSQATIEVAVTSAVTVANIQPA
jgi:hypothetical protein